jgi:peptide/histidine transporter 3/4
MGLLLDILYPQKYSDGITYIIFCLGFLMFPLLGLLADVWIGRFRAITIGIVMCFISWIITGIVYAIKEYLSQIVPLFFTVFGVGALLEIIGYSSFQANIVQYNIDQLIGASANKLSIIIYLHSATFPVFYCTFEIVRLFYNSILLPSFIISGICVSLVLVTHSLFKHLLEIPSLVDNPIRLIVRVLNYARKHKYPENRSALTYWEENIPSRIDLGKEKYGGPFSEEEVENVKTFFRMIPLFIALIGYGCSTEVNRQYTSGNIDSQHSIINRFITVHLFKLLTAVFCFVIYMISNKFLYKYIPSLLKRIGFGLIIALCSLITSAVIVKVYEDQNQSLSLYYAIIAPQVLNGIMFFLIIPSSLEFTIAQTPVQMRGVMVGLWYASRGIGYTISVVIENLFRCNTNYICTNFYYYITKGGIVLLITIVFIVVAMRYKFRVRENEIHIHQIADDHYQRYIDQDEQYRRDSSLSDESD